MTPCKGSQLQKNSNYVAHLLPLLGHDAECVFWHIFLKLRNQKPSLQGPASFKNNCKSAPGRGLLEFDGDPTHYNKFIFCTQT